MDIDSRKLHFKDFWEDDGSAKPRSYEGNLNYNERMLAYDWMRSRTFGQKFRRRYLRNAQDFRLIGKKTVRLNGVNYILLAFQKFEARAIRISLFSKRTNDYVCAKYFYFKCEKESELVSFAKEKFYKLQIKCDLIKGSRLM